MAEEDTSSTSSYRRILTATSLLGGAAAINMLIGVGRAKIVALMLGPAGVGIMGIYLSVTGLVAQIAFAGMNMSAVREIAAATGSGDAGKAKEVILTFRRLAFWLGLVATVGLAVFCQQASKFAFDDASHAQGLAILALTVAASVGGNYYGALLQAAGKVGRTAKLNVYTGIAATVIAVVCFIVWRRDGIVPALLLGALINWAQSWWLSRDVSLPSPDTTTHFSWTVGRRLLTLGVFTLSIGVMLNIANLWVRKIIITDLGEAAAGHFQSAAALSMLFATYVLNAMGTDFLPRISAAVNDHARMNQMINDQTAVALLLGLPGVVGTIAGAPLVVPLFYSSEFADAVPVLQLMSVGVFARLLLWPLGFSLIAKNAVVCSLSNEVVSHLVNIGALILLIPHVGVRAAGYASIIMYLVCGAVLYLMMKRVTGLCWSKQVRQVLLVGLGAIAVVFFSEWRLEPVHRWIVEGIVLLLCCWYSMHRLASGAEVTTAGIVSKLRSVMQRRSQKA